MKELIQKLTGIPGPSGHEEHIRQAILGEVSPFADEVREDSLGNLIVLKGQVGKGLRILVAAHMDEIGLVATHIDSQGFIRFTISGEVNLVHLHGRQVRFTNGVSGVVGSEQTEIKKTIPDINRMFIDIGASSSKDHLIRIGDTASLEPSFLDLGNRLVGKALDGRVACAVMIAALHRMKPVDYEIDLVFTTQKEVGTRGAITSAYSIDPMIGISIGLTDADDTPGEMHKSVSLGKGPAIKIRDRSVLSHPAVIQWMEKTAGRKGLPYQREVQENGISDASAVQITRAGVPVGGISIPCRYLHSPAEMVDMRDVESAVTLLVALLEKPMRL